MSIKHIYCFAFYDMSAPSVRYRLKYPLEKLEADYGIDYDLIHPGYDFKNLCRFAWIFCVILLFRKRDSLIIFQKIYTKGIYATALKILLFFRPKNTLYDIDDAEYIRHSAETVRHFMKHCSACSTGSETLREYAEKYNANAFVLTSPIIYHDEIKKTRNQLFTIGWIGFYSGHRENLNTLLFPAIKALSEPIKLVLLGVRNAAHRQEVYDYFSGNKNIKIEIPEDIDWLNEVDVYRRIKTFDIGVSPLIDNEFNRAKSAFKLKQYLSAGVPALCSPIGENLNFMDAGIEGFFCDSPEEFKTSILKLKNINEQKYSQLCFNTTSKLHTFDIQKYCIDLLKNIQGK